MAHVVARHGALLADLTDFTHSAHLLKRRQAAAIIAIQNKIILAPSRPICKQFFRFFELPGLLLLKINGRPRPFGIGVFRSLSL
jgi:hypothetical protein